jgi:hypothetical protein
LSRRNTWTSWESGGAWRRCLRNIKLISGTTIYGGFSGINYYNLCLSLAGGQIILMVVVTGNGLAGNIYFGAQVNKSMTLLAIDNFMGI